MLSAFIHTLVAGFSLIAGVYHLQSGIYRRSKGRTDIQFSIALFLFAAYSLSLLQPDTVFRMSSPVPSFLHLLDHIPIYYLFLPILLLFASRQSGLRFTLPVKFISLTYILLIAGMFIITSIHSTTGADEKPSYFSAIQRAEALVSLLLFVSITLYGLIRKKSPDTPFPISYVIVSLLLMIFWGYDVVAGNFTGSITGGMKYVGLLIFLFTQSIQTSINSCRDESKLRSSEATARALINNPDDIRLLTDLDGIILDLNETAVEHLGKPRPSLIGTSVWDLFPPDITEARKRHVETVRKTGMPERFEDKRNGNYFNHLIYPVFNDNGTLGGFAVTTRNITRRKEVEKSLLNSEERFHTLFEHMPSGVAIYEAVDDGADFIFTDMNRAALQLDGLTKNNIMGRRLTDVFPGVKEMGLFQRLNQVWKTGIPEFHPDACYRDATRQPAWRENWIFKLPSGNIVAIFNDITSRKQTELALEESERIHRELSENLPQKIFRKDVNLRYVSCNKNYADDLGIAPEEIVDKTDFDFHPKKLAEKYRSDDRRLMESGKTEAIIEKYIKNGENMTIQTIKKPLYDNKGNPAGILGIFRDITEQEKNRLMLKQAGDIVNNIQIGLHVYKVEKTDSTETLRLLSTNGTAMAILQCSSEEIIGKTCAEVFGFITERDIFRRFSEVAHSGKPFERYDVAYTGPSGEGFYSVKAFPLPDECIGISFEDVTERKRLAVDLKEALEVSEGFFKSIPTGIYIYHFTPPDGLFLIGANRAAESITGVTLAEWQGREFNEIWPEAKKQGITEAYLNVARTGKIYETENLSYADKRVQAAFRIRAFRLPAERIAVAFEDVTEQVVAKRELEQREHQFRQLVDNINEVFWLYDLNTNRFIYISPAFRRIWGVDPENLPKNEKDILDMVHPEDTACMPLYSDLTGDRIESNLEYRIIRGDQSIRWIRERRFPVLNEKKVVMRIAGLWTDITGFKEAAEKEKLHRQQLQQADKMASLGILVSGVAHEVNNPNNFIMLNTPLLREAWEDAKPVLAAHYQQNSGFELGGLPFPEMAESIPQLFDGIERGAQRIKLIVEDLKNYARQGSTHYEDTVDLNRVVQEASSLMKNLISKRTNNFSAIVSDTPVLIRGNRQKLEQVVINLLQNACYALNSQNDRITIAVRPGETEHQITVTDEGTGIAQEDIPQITDPFFTTRRADGGTGLGLSVSAGIVNEHNGRLTFDSTIGKGTTATILLPRIRKGMSNNE